MVYLFVGERTKIRTWFSFVLLLVTNLLFGFEAKNERRLLRAELCGAYCLLYL